MDKSNSEEKSTVYFSNFATSGKLDNAIAITRTVPRWYKGDRIEELAPPMSLIQRYKKNPEGQWKHYMQEYMCQVYFRDDLEDIYRQCQGKVLLCFCKKTAFCHRQLVAKTFEIDFNAVCKEVGGWEIPFAKSYEEYGKEHIFTLSRYDAEDQPVQITGNYKKLRGTPMLDKAWATT